MGVRQWQPDSWNEGYHMDTFREYLLQAQTTLKLHDYMTSPASRATPVPYCVCMLHQMGSAAL